MRVQRSLTKLTGGEKLSTLELIILITELSLPAIAAQITQVVMEYVDASMVGQLGAGSSAAIGLIGPTTWLFGSLMYAAVMGFSIQMAQYIGARDRRKAHDILYEGLTVILIVSVLGGALCVMLSGPLPVFLGGSEEIVPLSSSYFRIYALGAPVMVMGFYFGAMLQSSGKLLVSGLIQIIICIMNVVFNFFCIFDEVPVRLGDTAFKGLGLGVAGAALGTVMAQALGLLIFIICMFKFNDSWHYEGKAGFHKADLQKAFRIALPLAVEETILQGAQIASILIVSPLGTVSIAAHSLAVTAEGLCYMPGNGVQQAASTLIGQSTGAGRKDLIKKLSVLVVGFGMLIMTVMGVLLYFFAGTAMGVMTPDTEVRELGTAVLRIEAFAEPFFAAYIVSSGVFRGMGDTVTPSVISMSSMWLIRIPLAFFLSARMGLRGVWIAMAVELTVRGLVMISRLAMKKQK